MTRRALPPGMRRQRVDLTLAGNVVALLDVLVAAERTTRSALVEQLLMREFATRPREGDVGYVAAPPLATIKRERKARAK